MGGGLLAGGREGSAWWWDEGGCVEVEKEFMGVGGGAVSGV